MGRLNELGIKLKNARLKNQSKIEDGLYVKDEFLTFAPFSVLDGAFSIMLPTNFTIIPWRNNFLKTSPVHSLASFRDWRGIPITHDPRFFGKSTVMNGILDEVANNDLPTLPRHDEIWGKPNAKTSLCFSFCRDIEIDAEHLVEKAEDFKQDLKKRNSVTDFYESGIYDLPDIKIAWFDHSNYRIGQHMYNIIFISSVEGKLLQGAFTCPFYDFRFWNCAAHQIIKSIRTFPLPKFF